MQALLLAAGVSSRFFPYNNKHKCLVKIAGQPIIVHTIRSVKKSGITDIVLVVPNDHDFQDVLGTGKKYGVKITYVIYTKAEGAGEAILASEKQIKGDFFLVNSNHVEFSELRDSIDSKRDTNRDVVLLAKENTDGKHFGMLKTEGDRVLSIVEKPKSPDGLSNLRVIGVYFLNQDFVKVLKKEKKDHYSLEAAIDKFAKAGRVKFAVTTTETMSLKYPWDLLNIKNYILKKQTRSISNQAVILEGAIVQGNVVIEEGARVCENAVVKGPAYIGRNTFVGSNTLVRNGSDIEENCVVGGYMEVKNSLIFSDSKTHSGHFEDSILGENSRLGAFFATANVRLDRKNIVSKVKGERVDSSLRSLGIMIGANVRTGARVTTMPGVIIGNNVNIGPSTTVMDNIDSNTTFYTEFSKIVKKTKPAKSEVK